jgi:hypothetical protein
MLGMLFCPFASLIAIIGAQAFLSFSLLADYLSALCTQHGRFIAQRACICQAAM